MPRLTDAQIDRIADFKQLPVSSIVVDHEGAIVNAETCEEIGSMKGNGAIIERHYGYAVINADGDIRFMQGWYYDHKGRRVH